MQNYIEIKIIFGRNTYNNPNNYSLTKVFKFSCATYHFDRNEIKVHQDHQLYNFDLDEVDELFIKQI